MKIFEKIWYGISWIMALVMMAVLLSVVWIYTKLSTLIMRERGSNKGYDEPAIIDEGVINESYSY